MTEVEEAVPPLEDQAVDEPDSLGARLVGPDASASFERGVARDHHLAMAGMSALVVDDHHDDHKGATTADGASAAAAAPKGRARRRGLAPGEPPATMWKKRHLITKANAAIVARFAQDLAGASSVTNTYFVPEAALDRAGVRDLLAEVLTAKPKSKKFQGRETSKPWPLWHARAEPGTDAVWWAVPRTFGAEVLGVPPAAQVHVWDGAPLNPQLGPPLLPLLDEAGGKRMNKINQERAVDRLEHELRAEAQRRGFAGRLFLLSPGFGKTCCAAHLIRRLGRRTLFVVPNRDFIPQVSEELQRILGPALRVGHMTTKVERNWRTVDKDVVLTTFASVSDIVYDLTPYGLVIVDEVHEAVTARNSKMFYRFGARYVVGLTATPERSDHCGGYLRWLIGPPAWYEMNDIMCSRWGKVDVTVYDMHYERYPMRETCMRGPEGRQVLYLEGMYRQLFRKYSRNRFLLEDVVLQRVRQGRRCLLLGTRVRHMEMLRDELERRYDVPTGLIVGSPSDGRELTPEQKALAKTKQVLIITASIGYKALNIPELDTLVALAPPHVNDTWWTQAAGRITRDLASKQQPEIVMLRDTYTSRLRPHTQGMFACMADNACKTLAGQSEGYQFVQYSVTV